MTPDWTCVLFDLDGTIADSAPGITATLAWTLERLGVPVPPPAELVRWVGPPILDSFRDLAHLDPQQSARALELYRDRYLSEGALDSAIFPGMAELLEHVHAAGLPSSLATSKPETPARTMLNRFGVGAAVGLITGASDDESRSRKADVVQEALLRLSAAGHDISRPVMVGDRIHDVQGARERGVPTIFAAWGYGSPAEAVGAVAVARTPAELERMLLG